MLPATVQALCNRLSNATLNVVICGCGKVGPGIAGNYLAQGHQVTLFDLKAEALQAAQKQIEADLAFLAWNGLCEPQHAELGNRLTLTTVIGEIGQPDIVIEAVFEDLLVKQGLLRQICSIVTADCVVGSNTSTLDLQAMVSAITHPERFMGIHFVYPASLVPEMELAHVSETSPEILQAMHDVYLRRLGRRPALLRAQPGLFGNRQQFAAFDVALRMMRDRGMSIAQVDCAFRGICQQIATTGIFGFHYLAGNPPVFAATANVGENPYLQSGALDELRRQRDRFANALTQVDGLSAVSRSAEGEVANALVQRWLEDGIKAVNDGVGTMMAFETMLRAFARRYAATGIIGAAYLGGLPLFAKLYQLMAQVNGYQQPLPGILSQLNDGTYVEVDPYANNSEVLELLATMRDKVLLAAIMPPQS